MFTAEMTILGNTVPVWIFIIFLIGALILIASVVLIAYGLLNYRRYPQTQVKKKYCFLIPAKNEATVIADSIDSIKKLNYPQELITIYILANNCTDQTVEISKKLNAAVHQLDDPTVKNVGTVINRFFKYIKEKYGSYYHYDGYIRLDAGNLVDEEYLNHLNDAFVQTGGVITTYRANMNFNDGIVASLTCVFMSLSMLAFRMFSGWRASPIITGPGILLSAEVIDQMNGWNTSSISEDLELSAIMVKIGIKVNFAYNAIFYDEQPNKIKYAFRQRLRWQTGKSQVFFKSWGSMIKKIFSKNGLSALFMTIGLIPMGFLTILFTSVFAIYGIIIGVINSSWQPILMFGVLPIIFNIILAWFLAILVMLVERKRIKIDSFFKRIAYVFVFPLSLFMQSLADFVRVFIKVTWKPIPHGQIKDKEDT